MSDENQQQVANQQPPPDPEPARSPAPAAAPAAAPAQPPPVQWLEPMPDWVREELNDGREGRPALRKALCAAQLEVKGLIHKVNANAEQNYKYIGHEDVIERVRDAMAKHGISVDQASLTIERSVDVGTSGGAKPRWYWRGLCLVSHTEGGVVLRVVRAMTMCNDKAAFVARTAIDRTLRMTLMGVAGSREDPENDAPDGPGAREQPQQQAQQRPAQQEQRQPPREQHRDQLRGQQGGQAQAAAQRQQPTGSARQTPEDKRKAGPDVPTAEQEAKIKQLVDQAVAGLAPCTTESLLVDWARIWIEETEGLPQKAKAYGWGEFGKRAAELKIGPDTVVKQAKQLGPMPRTEYEPGATAAPEADPPTVLSGVLPDGQPFKYDAGTGAEVKQ